MKKIFFCLFTFYFVSISHSQQDTIYYKKNWDVTSVHDSAAYYRLWSISNSIFKVEDHFINGKLQMTGSCKRLDPEIREGFFQYFSDEGSLKSEGEYKNDLKTGAWKIYYPNGAIWLAENYYKDKLDGAYTGYYKSGKVRREEEYKNGKFIQGKCFTEAGADTTYFPFEQMPEYVGGIQAMNDFIAKNTKYPKKARKKNIEGKVMVKFVVTEIGKIENVEIVKGANELLDEEALRVIKSMPDWKPGKQDGYPIRVYYNIPINFKLPD